MIDDTKIPHLRRCVELTTGKLASVTSDRERSQVLAG